MTVFHINNAKSAMIIGLGLLVQADFGIIPRMKRNVVLKIHIAYTVMRDFALLLLI